MFCQMFFFSSCLDAYTDVQLSVVVQNLLHISAQICTVPLACWSPPTSTPKRDQQACFCSSVLFCMGVSVALRCRYLTYAAFDDFDVSYVLEFWRLCFFKGVGCFCMASTNPF